MYQTTPQEDPAKFNTVRLENLAGLSIDSDDKLGRDWRFKDENRERESEQEKEEEEVFDFSNMSDDARRRRRRMIKNNFFS